MESTILTADHVYFDFANPCGFTLNAIARGLANTCRFGGQCERFYSVAEHSVWVSRIVPPQWAIAGLLHDAAEAFIGDMVKPLKVLLPDFQAVERRVEAAIFAHFGLPETLPKAVKSADMDMLRTEQIQLMKNNDVWKWTGKILPIQLDMLSPEDAYHEFMKRAAQLGLNE